MVISARYVVPISSPVIEDGAVVVAEGRIQSLGKADTIRKSTAKDTEQDIDHGDCVILPGLVNAHTHLELSLLGGQVETGTELTDWLLRLMASLKEKPPTAESTGRAVATGIERSLSAGVTMIGDITRNPAWSRPILAESGLRGVSFGEVLSIGKRRARLAGDPAALPPSLDAAASWSHVTDYLRAGVSPHSPYTVEPDAMRACARVAARVRSPVCVHVCETAHEDAFTRNRTGKLADYLRDLGVWDDEIPASHCGPVELLRDCGLLGARTVLAHANFVSAKDIAMIAQSATSVAFCPRTHAAFGHPPHRFREMLQAGVNVCIGTDSLASNPSLSVLEELRFLRRRAPDVSPDRLVAMATLNGAKALGLDRSAGSLTVGKLADLVVIPLGRESARRGWSSILDTTESPRAVYLGGRRVV